MQFLALELGDEREAGVDKVLELGGLAAQVLELPEAQQHGGYLLGQHGDGGEVIGAEAVDGVAVEIDDAEDLAVGGDERGGEFGADGGADGDVAWIGPDIGHELGAAVKGDPAGDTLAWAERDLVDVGGHALVDLDLEFTRVGIQQGNGARGGAEVGDGEAQDLGHGRPRVIGGAGEAADGVEQDGVGAGRRSCGNGRSGRRGRRGVHVRMVGEARRGGKGRVVGQAGLAGIGWASMSSSRVFWKNSPRWISFKRSS